MRCAIYTRKSTDEGLEKQFNTLEAQREAGENYIKAQRHQGWELIDKHYDDGGYSGGNMNRPAFQELLTDIQANKVDMVVIYKIDRLTRSLLDFSKMIEIFDKHHCSFVSVTQNINTADSMGRLMLNVLLSFAQFEREISGERIRDKILASKKKGMWVGGVPPFGYKGENKKLVVVPEDAEKVKHVYELFLSSGNLSMVGHTLLRENCTFRGKVPGWTFLRSMLNNRVYIGEITHKGTSFPGQHQPIIDKETFESAQNLFKSNTQKIRRRRLKPVSKNEENGLLRGILSCGCCEQKLYPRYSLKKDKRYYYYTDSTHKKYGPHSCRLNAIPMHLLDNLVMDLLNPLIKSPYVLQALAQEACQVQANLKESEVFYAMRETDSVFQQLTGAQKEKIVSLLVQGVTIFADKIIVVWKPLALHLMDKRLKASLKPNELKPELMESTVPFNLITHRGSKEIHLPETVSDMLYLTSGEKPSKKEDRYLIKILANGFTYRETQEAKNLNLHELAEVYHQDPAYIGAQIRLTFLAPDIIDAILRGAQPKTMTARELLRASIPASWPEQRKLFGFPPVKD